MLLPQVKPKVVRKPSGGEEERVLGSHVFLSYGREDSAEADRLRAELEHRGFEVWIDTSELRGGQLWKQALARAIREARYFIALMSTSSTTRESTATWELRQALERQAALPDDAVFVVPARLDECAPPVADLEDFHWIDLYPDWAEGVKRVLRALTEDTQHRVGGAANATRSIHGLVVNDREADGQLSHGDALPGAVLQLWRGTPGTELVATTETDVRGAYYFDGIGPGVYTIRVVPGTPSYQFDILRDLGVNSVTVEVSESSARVVGSSNPGPLPRWNLRETRPENLGPTHFVFLSKVTFLAGQVRSGGCVVAGVPIVMRRCQRFNPEMGRCEAYLGTGVTVVTDRAGRFQFNGLLEGIYQLAAMHDGRELHVTAVLSADGPVIGADFEF